ncbi:MAG: hypothetical protein ABR562_06190, partial [Thermoplasmatota archaeon]
AGLVGVGFGVPALVCGIAGARQKPNAPAVIGIVCGSVLILTLPFALVAGIGRQGGTVGIDAVHSGAGACTDRHVRYQVHDVHVGSNFTHRHTDVNVTVWNVGAGTLLPSMLFVHENENWTTLDVTKPAPLESGSSENLTFRSGTYDPHVVVRADGEPRSNGLSANSIWTSIGLKYYLWDTGPVQSDCNVTTDGMPEAFLA